MQAGIAGSQFVDALQLVAELSARLAKNFSAYSDLRTWRDFAMHEYLKQLIYVAHHAEAPMTLPTNGEASEIDELQNIELAGPLLTFTHVAMAIGTRKAIHAIQMSPHLSTGKTEAIEALQKYSRMNWRSLTEALRRAKGYTARRQREAANFPNLGGKPPIR